MSNFSLGKMPGCTPRLTRFTICAYFIALTLNGLARDDAWLGVRTPEERRGAREANLGRTSFELGWGGLSLRLAEDEDPYQDIKGEKIHGYVREVAEFSQQSRRAGDPMWGRIAGGPFERAAAKYVAERFRAWGLEEVRIEDVDRRPRWWPLDWELTLLADPAYGPATRDYTFGMTFPSSGSGDTPEEGVQGELVYVGLGRPEDLIGRDVRGKIALVRSFLQPSLFAHTAAGAGARLTEAGAIGIVTVLDVAEAVRLTGRGIASRTAPGFSLNADDGAFLLDLIASAGAGNPPRVRMRLTSEIESGLKTPNVYGQVSGEIDEYVIVTAHTDAYFEGASDNASGIGNMLALAEHYGRGGAPKPRRNILFVATAGHHGGSVGVAHMISEYSEMMEKTVFVLNCEHVGTQLHMNRRGAVVSANVDQPLVVSVSSRSPLLIRELREAIDRYGVPVLQETSHRPAGDASRFARAGVTVINLIGSNMFYHTSGDTTDRISAPGLERIARASAYLIDRTMQATRAQLEQGSRPMNYPDGSR